VAAATPSTDGLWSPRHRTLTLGLVLTITLVAFEALAVATIMPIVSRDLGDIQLYGWVFTAFFLGNLLGIVVVGGVIDRGGLVVPFVAGLTLFSLGLIGGGLAPSMIVLVGARFIQGLGAGAIPPIAYVCIGRALPESLRPRMFATLSTAWVLPGVVGPALSGTVAELWHWRVVFLGLLPLILLAGVMTLPAIRRLPASESGSENASDRPRDRLLPAVLVAAGAGLILAGLGTDQPLVAALLISLGVVLGVPAYRRLTPAGTILVRRGLPAAVLLRGLLTMMFFCADAYVPLALQQWRGVPAAISGIALTAATLSWTGGAWIQAHRIERLGARRFVTIGFLTTGLGVLAFAAILSPSIPVVVGVVAWAIAGLGMGLSYSPLSLVVLAEAAPETQGAATSGLQLSDVLGTAFGTGIGGAFVAAGHRLGWDGWIGLAGAFGVAVAVAAIGAMLASRLPAARVQPATESRRVGRASPAATGGEP
jgi:MFS family permease